MTSGRVVVVGSANLDVVVAVGRRPGGGETVLGADPEHRPGGKGANQAVAASRAGAATTLVAALGDDEAAAVLRAALTDAGVNTGALHTSARPTGTAYILVTPDGENSIVVAPGANAHLTVAVTERWGPLIDAADVVVVSLEIPMATVEHVVARCVAAGVRVVLNASPAAALPPAVLAAADPLVVNEHEARLVLTGGGQPRSQVVTLGAAGAVVRQGDGPGVPVPAVPVTDVVDTTGAGDAFTGALAAALAAGGALLDAVEAGAAAAATCVRHRGAQLRNVAPHDA